MGSWFTGSVLVSCPCQTLVVIFALAKAIAAMTRMFASGLVRFARYISTAITISVTGLATKVSECIDANG